MRKARLSVAVGIVCCLMVGLLAGAASAEILAEYRFTNSLAEIPEDSTTVGLDGVTPILLESLTATNKSQYVTASYFTINLIGYDEQAIMDAYDAGVEFLSFTGDSDEPPACNSEPWQPVSCTDECTSGPCTDICTYEKAWLFKVEASGTITLDSLVFDSRRLGPGKGGSKYLAMPGVTGYRILVNHVEVTSGALVLDNAWHSVAVNLGGMQVSGPVEIEMVGTGAQPDDPIPWRVDNVTLSGSVQ